MKKYWYIIFIASFFVWNKPALAQEKKGADDKSSKVDKNADKGLKKALTMREMRKKRREDRIRRKEESKKFKAEKKAIKKHQKEIQSEATFKRMQKSRKKADKKNRKNGF